MDRVVDGWHILNAGSVGVPLDGVPAASYMILDGDATGWRAMQRRVPFDYERLYAEFERQNFVERVGAAGQLIIEEFKAARLRLLPCPNWIEAAYPGETLTSAHADEFLQMVDPNSYMMPAYRGNRE
jgi:hypothetical protein